MQAKTIDKSEFFKPGQDDYERERGRMGRAGQGRELDDGFKSNVASLKAIALNVKKNLLICL